jgi:hypothetical protein
VDHLMEEIRAYRLGRAGLSLNASSTQTKVWSAQLPGSDEN